PGTRGDLLIGPIRQRAETSAENPPERKTFSLHSALGAAFCPAFEPAFLLNFLPHRRITKYFFGKQHRSNPLEKCFSTTIAKGTEKCHFRLEVLPSTGMDEPGGFSLFFTGGVHERRPRIKHGALRAQDWLNGSFP